MTDNLKDQPEVSSRRRYIEQKLNLKLPHISHFSLDETSASTKNCENMIGITQIPLGIAGPLKIVNCKLKIENFVYIPLATTEGALVASVNRGAKAVTQSGGAVTAVENVGATRGPVFKTKGIKESLEFKKWLDDNFDILNQQAQKSSSHIRLIKLDTRTSGKHAFVRFYFDTEEAMGMNMATFASSAITGFIEKQTG